MFEWNYLRGRDTVVRQASVKNVFASIVNRGLLQKERICPQEKNSFLRGLIKSKAKMGVMKMVKKFTNCIYSP